MSLRVRPCSNVCQDNKSKLQILFKQIKVLLQGPKDGPKQTVACIQRGSILTQFELVSQASTKRKIGVDFCFEFSRL